MIVSNILNADVAFLVGYVLLSFITLIILGLLFWRRYFGLKSVNCWFCNADSEVEDDQVWICLNCEQYNGFNEDGDYSDKVKALQQKNHYSPQQVALQASKNYKAPSKISPSKLCKKCAGNQLLKINQLAAFVPIYDDNFDAEVEHFRKRLETLYALCGRCNKLATNHIQHQNNILTEKFKNFTKNLPNHITIKSPNPVKKRASKCSCTLLFFLSFLIGVFASLYSTWNHMTKSINLFNFQNILSFLTFFDKVTSTLTAQTVNMRSAMVEHHNVVVYVIIPVIFTFVLLYFVCVKSFKSKKSSSNFKLKKGGSNVKMVKQEFVSPKKMEVFSDSEMEVDEEEDLNSSQYNLNDSMSLLGFGATKSKQEAANVLPTPPPSTQSSIVSSHFDKRPMSLNHLPSDRGLPFRRYASTINKSNNLMNSMSFNNTHRISQSNRSFVSPPKFNVRTAKSFKRKNTAYVHSTKSDIGLWSRNKPHSGMDSRSVMTSPYSRTAQWLHRTNPNLNSIDEAEEPNTSWSCSWENKSDVSVNDSASQLMPIEGQTTFTPTKKHFPVSESSPRSIFTSVSMQTVKAAEQSRLCCWLLVICLLLNLVLIAMLYFQIKGMQVSPDAAASKWGS